MTETIRSLTKLALVAGLLALGCGGDDSGPDIDAAAGQDPTASFTITPDCTTTSSDEIEFVSTSTDPQSQTLTCSWNFASCTNGSCTSTNCTQGGITFPNAAPYTITLTVTDTDGNDDTTTMTIDRC